LEAAVLELRRFMSNALASLQAALLTVLHEVKK
jgi:hypothetical protein